MDHKVPVEFRASLLEEILHLERENCNLAAPLAHTHLELAHLKYLSALIKKPNFIYTYTRCSLQLNAVKSVAFYIHINSQLLTFRVQPQVRSTNSDISPQVLTLLLQGIQLQSEIGNGYAQVMWPVEKRRVATHTITLQWKGDCNTLT